MLYGDTRRGAFPSDVKAAVQYSENLQSLAVALNTVGAVSIKRTHEILSGVFNIPIATGTIRSIDYLKIMFYVGTAHKQGYNAYEAIKNAISGHPDFIFE